MPERWWRDAVIYQIYPRSFMDANGDGIGDLDGITSKVDYLADVLGVDAVWLSPFFRSPMADFGYDVADYIDVDPIFGDLDAFDRLLAALHGRGIRLIVDFVPNHSSDQHEWFQESRSSRTNPKRDWYVWRDSDDGPPNNWLSVFGGSAWEWDEATDQWYLHSFLKEQPDLNWRNPEVVEAMHDVMRFWLDRGVDGFRIDVAHFMMKDPGFRDNPPAPLDGDAHFKDMGEYDRWRHVHDKGHPDIHGVFGGMRDVLDEYEPPRFAVGEIHVLDDLEAWAAYYGASDGAGLHMPFNFSLLYVDWSASAVREVVDAIERVVPSHGWPNYVFGNHDESRIASRFGEARSRAAAMILLTLRGTPTIYYGDELGMPEVAIPEDEQQDPWGIRVAGLGRDGCRTPMAWDATPNAGCGSEQPWLPLHPDAAIKNVASELEDPTSHLALYRALLDYRRSSITLRRGTYDALGDDAQVFAYRRDHPDAASVLVALNFGSEPARWEVPGDGVVVASTGMDRVGERVGGELLLGPDEGVLVELA